MLHQWIMLCLSRAMMWIYVLYMNSLGRLHVYAAVIPSKSDTVQICRYSPPPPHIFYKVIAMQDMYHKQNSICIWKSSYHSRCPPDLISPPPRFWIVWECTRLICLMNTIPVVLRHAWCYISVFGDYALINCPIKIYMYLRGNENCNSNSVGIVVPGDHF